MRVAKGTMLDVDREAKMVEKICAQDGLLDVCNDEYPAEIAAESEIEGARAHTKGHDRSAVDCL